MDTNNLRQIKTWMGKYFEKIVDGSKDRTVEAKTKDLNPELIASSPSEGPTIASSIIRAGAGSLPDFRIFAKSLASLTVKLPVI